MFLPLVGYGMAAIGAYAGYQNIMKLQSDVGEVSTVKALLKLDPTGLVQQQPVITAQAKTLDAAIAADKTAILLDGGLIAIGLFIATRDR